MPVTNFFWDGDNLLHEYGGGDATAAHYVTEPSQYGNFISQEQGGETSFFHFDGIGSLTEATNDESAVSSTRRFSSFGVLAEGGLEPFVSCAFIGKSGYHYDVETGLYYVRRRYLAVIGGSWISVDPYDSFDSRINVYIYATANPVTHTDPSGLVILMIPCAGAAITFAHGQYCGAFKKGPPPPVDCVDIACEEHDRSLDFWSFCNPFTRKLAHGILCYSATACGAPGGGAGQNLQA